MNDDRFRLLNGWGKRSANFVFFAFIIASVYVVFCAFFGAFFGTKYDENIFFGLIFWAIVFAIPVGFVSSLIMNWRNCYDRD